MVQFLKERRDRGGELPIVEVKTLYSALRVLFGKVIVVAVVLKVDYGHFASHSPFGPFLLKMFQPNHKLSELSVGGCPCGPQRERRLMANSALAVKGIQG